MTLGSMGIARGLSLIIVAGLPVYLASSIPGINLFLNIFSGKLFNLIPTSIIFTIIVYIVGGIVLSRTVFGTYVYATGGNPKTARLSGINIKNIRLTAFVITGFLSGLAGILGMASIQNGSGLSGTGYELDVIAAVIIGGTSLAGGGGSILGTLLGVLLMNFIRNGLVLLGIEPYTQMVIVGFIIIIAVTIDKLIRRNR